MYDARITLGSGHKPETSLVFFLYPSKINFIMMYINPLISRQHIAPYRFEQSCICPAFRALCLYNPSPAARRPPPAAGHLVMEADIRITARKTHCLAAARTDCVYNSIRKDLIHYNTAMKIALFCSLMCPRRY